MPNLPSFVTRWSLLITLSCWLAATQVFAQTDHQPLLVRTSYSFDQAIDTAEQHLINKGYTVVFTQKCDNALGHYQYATDSYRVLMFSKLDFSRQWLPKYPEIAAFLPLRLAVFAEGDDTMLASYHPMDIAKGLNTPELNPFFEQWAQDIEAIMQTMNQAK